MNEISLILQSKQENVGNYRLAIIPDFKDDVFDFNKIKIKITSNKNKHIAFIIENKFDYKTEDVFNDVEEGNCFILNKAMKFRCVEKKGFLCIESHFLNKKISIQMLDFFSDNAEKIFSSTTKKEKEFCKLELFLEEEKISGNIEIPTISYSNDYFYSRRLAMKKKSFSFYFNSKKEENKKDIFDIIDKVKRIVDFEKTGNTYNVRFPEKELDLPF